MSKRMDARADVAMIGLGVMGRNLALNMADHGFKVAAYNLETEWTERFIAENPDTPGGLVGCRSLRSLVAGLKRPRKITMMITSGKPVDIVNGQLLPLLDEDDVVIDGGNSLYTNTIRREKELARRGVHFVGSGVSGGEEGARFGPSLMPGCSRAAWASIRPVWNAIAARVDKKTGKPLEGAAPGKPVKGGEPCAAHIGTDGSGHYVKMVHNGIEYSDMQLISEAYFLLQSLLGLKPDELSKIFAQWNRGDLDSFLIEISSDILRQRDPAKPRSYLIDSVLDTAGQKGTGKWTSINGLELGVPVATISEAVFARFISALKAERVAASKTLKGPKYRYRGSKRALVDAIRDALYCSKVCSYAQGFDLISSAQKEYGWKIDFQRLAKIWRGGCIIRARFLQKIADAYATDRKLANLLLDPYFTGKIRRAQANWRKVVTLAAEAGVPCPAFMSALSYYDSYRSARLPANMLQAQRDYFGAHAYERIDQPRGRFFHVDWLDPERPQIRTK